MSSDYHILAGVVCYLATIGAVCFCYWVEKCRK